MTGSVAPETPHDRGPVSAPDPARLEAPPIRLTTRQRLHDLFWRRIWLVSSLLYALAWVWRRLMWRTTFVAITGTHGKTTCKELTADLLATRFPTCRSLHNLNARAGVAVNVLRVRPWHRFAVLEISAGNPGDMATPARVVRPHIAAVLCLKRTHTLAFPGGLAQHAAEKSHLTRALARGGVAVLNDDDPLVRSMPVPDGANIVRIGFGDSADLRVLETAGRWPDRFSATIACDGERTVVPTQLVGAHWWPTVLTALAIGRAAGVPLAEAATALADTPPYIGRMQPVALPSGAEVLRDDYNASVDGSEPALHALAVAEGRRRVLVATDFSDTGMNRPKRLRWLAQIAAESSDVFVVVGESAAYGVRRAVDAGLSPAAAHGFTNLQEAAAFLRAELRAGDLVLIKGRTTDHAGRLLWAQFGPISCWRVYCPKRQVCDTCAELGSPAALAGPLPAPPLPPRA